MYKYIYRSAERVQCHLIRLNSHIMQNGNKFWDWRDLIEMKFNEIITDNVAANFIWR